MTTEPRSEGPRTSKRLLWSVVLLMLLGAGLLWAAGSVEWASQAFRLQFGGERRVGASGGDVRPELVPLALAGLAAVAAVLATGGWLRRVVGALVVVAGGLLVYRAVGQIDFGWFAGAGPGLPPGSTPIGEPSLSPIGPLLMSVGSVVLLGAGLLVVLRGGRMPAMGAKYAAPGEQRATVSHDPQRRMWDELDEGRDPTEDR
ncbi:Trp biosynthesis-associated membrane protein [Saccharopolyspora sp. CA-218241]|uniref:Trp biosynthesis-associated membrane protein n=1 Tax=Saccharopolyspora sp. CA-218241 TaxID=3240027 RepID=UPI003D977E45